jgi:hypothetical protein
MPADFKSGSDGLLAEFDFIREGMRQDQRERLVFLGFALASSGAVLGLLVRDHQHLPSGAQAFVLILVALAIAIVAEVMTIRATIGVASAGHYIREFIEPRAAGLRFQERNRHFLDELKAPRPRMGRLMRSSVSASWGLAIAYGVLTVALAVAWFTVDLSTPRDTLRDVLVVLGVLVSLGLAVWLWWTGHGVAQYVGRAWEAVKAGEDAGGSGSPR